MNSKTTILWLVIAVALAAGIFFWQRHERSLAPATTEILPHFQIAQVNAIEIFPSGATEIDVDGTNGGWELSKPISYPAQSTAIEALLGALQKLTPATKISATELRENKNSESEFGFENPQFGIDVMAGDQIWHLQVGNKTAPGDQVFVRVVGTDGAFVTSADWLKFIPHSANEWRDTSLLAAGENNFDSIVVTNGALILEFHRDVTNRLWRMLRPLPARADSARIDGALQELQTARIAQFVTDDSNADLTTFGLQPADLNLWFGHGTNFSVAIRVGKNAPDNPDQIFVKRDRWNSVFSVTKNSFALWRGTINDFRDPHLLELTAPVDEIEFRAADTNHFTLQKQNTNDWKILEENFPVDTARAQQFIKILAGLRIGAFVKDVVTAADLQSFGLTTNSLQITLRGEQNTNVLAKLIFGATDTNKNLIYVKRADEDFIYGLAISDFNLIPEHSWEFRKRRVWNFSETNVAQITLNQSGKTRVFVRNGANKWALAAGSQGIFNSPSLEETAHRLGEMSVYAWVGRNVTTPEQFGLNTNNLQITVELKSGEKFSTQFGAELPAAQTAIAAMTLEGERWAYVFSPVLYQFVSTYLTIPANVP
jgi:hypothetical protein